MGEMTTEERRREREERKRWRAVAEFVALVESHISELDREMRQPPDEGRGKRVAALTNALEIGKDMFKHFTLGMDLRRPAKSQLKPKRAKVSP